MNFGQADSLAVEDFALDFRVLGGLFGRGPQFRLELKGNPSAIPGTQPDVPASGAPQRATEPAC